MESQLSREGASLDCHDRPIPTATVCPLLSKIKDERECILLLTGFFSLPPRIVDDLFIPLLPPDLVVVLYAARFVRFWLLHKISLLANTLSILE